MSKFFTLLVYHVTCFQYLTNLQSPTLLILIIEDVQSSPNRSLINFEFRPQQLIKEEEIG